MRGGEGHHVVTFMMPPAPPPLTPLPVSFTCGAGVVLRAFKHGTEVALKCPRNKITLNARDLKSFTQEVTTMARVRRARECFRQRFDGACR